MSALEFFSSIVQALAWPISVILIVYTLKKPITDLFKGVSKFKYQDLEIDFEKKLEKIDQQISMKSKLKVEEEPTKLNNVYEEIETIANISPNAAIVMAWNLVEKEIQEAIMRLAISPDYPLHNSPLKNLRLLKENNLIDTETEKATNELRMLRNKAAHVTKDEEKITTVEALKYYNIAQKVVIILKSLSRN